MSLRITVIAVGNLKEAYWRQAAAEYRKRLLPYSKLEIKEVAPQRVRDENSAAEIADALRKEALLFRRALPEGATIVALDVQGQDMSSEDLAAWLERQALYEGGNVAFLIGGSHGLDGELLKEAHLRLSFSAFTFPHQLMRIILLEQLFRAQKIRRGEAYHK